MAKCARMHPARAGVALTRCLEGVLLKVGEFAERACSSSGRQPAISNTVKQNLEESSHRKGSLDIGSLLLHYDSSRPFERCYDLLDVVGQGSFGAVYRAKCTSTGELRAVKVMKMSKVRKDFSAVATEIEAMLRLSHPNVVRFHEFFEREGSICVVMGLCSGHFGQLIRCPVKDPEERRLLFRDVMMGVAYCHGKGIVHRDIKLENCLLYEGGVRVTAKVADFGLAAIRREADTDDSWLLDPLGTRCFVAPEVVQKRMRYGTKCDIWSLGVMLYVLLTREHPFSENPKQQESMALLREICTTPLRMKPLDRHFIENDAISLIGKLLVRNPHKRLDAASALDEPWLRPESAELALHQVLTKVHPEVLMRRLVSFLCLPLVAKVSLMMVAHSAASRQVEEMRNAFLALDAYGSGRLSKEMLQAGFANWSHQAAAAAEELEAALPQDYDVSYGVWVSATMEPSTMASEDAQKQLFSFFDADGDGSISGEELCRVVGAEEAKRVMQKYCGQSLSADLGWNEFRALMQDVAASRSEVPVH